MSWPSWLLTAAAVGVNLHAVTALVLSRDKPAPVVRRWARRSAWLAGAFVVLWGIVIVSLVRSGTSATGAADPAMRAAELARQISEGINCAAFGVLGSMLPVVVALWLGWKARRGS